MTSTSSLSHPYSDDFAASFWGQASKPLDKSHTLTPYTTTMHLDDLAPFSSPGSSRCSSSSSTSSPFQISSQFPVIEQFPEAAFAPQLSASPSLLPAACSYPNEWASLEAVVPQPPPPMLLPTTTTTTTNSSALSTPFEGGDLPQTVGEPSLIYRWPSSRHAGHQQLTDGPGGPAASAPSSSSAPIVPVSVPGSIAVPVPPVPLSRLDGVEWFALRRELTSAPGVVSDHDGLAVIDLAKWQDCLEYYWRFFHPLFPVVHRASFFLVKPSPLMAGAMVAIGSLFDGRRNSREYSTALLEACGKILAKVWFLEIS